MVSKVRLPSPMGKVKYTHWRLVRKRICRCCIPLFFLVILVLISVCLELGLYWCYLWKLDWCQQQYKKVSTNSTCLSLSKLTFCGSEAAKPALSASILRSWCKSAVRRNKRGIPVADAPATFTFSPDQERPSQCEEFGCKLVQGEREENTIIISNMKIGVSKG